MEGTAESGKQNLLFSLKQLEYLQYYIHHYQLADPKVVKEMTAGGAIPWPEECNFDEVEVDNWIPLPMNVLLPEVIGTIVSYPTRSWKLISATDNLQIPRSNQERDEPNHKEQQSSQKGGNDDARYSGRKE
jgi:hypothetical protein